MNKSSDENWISIKDEIPELKLEQWKDRIISISSPVKVKKSNGTIYTAKYVFLIFSSECPFPRSYWRLYGYTGNNEVELGMSEEDCWKELQEEHEGE